MDFTSLPQQLSNNIDNTRYSLEYLAIIMNNKSFDDTLRDFCTKFYLSIEESESDSFTASGNDFTIEAKFVSSGLSVSTSVLLKVFTDVEYDLQTAKELLEEQAIGTIFMDLVLLRDSIGERRNQEAYILLNEIENMLRKLIALKTASLSGNTWWNDRADTHLTDKRYLRRRNDEINDLEITGRDDQKYHEIFYIDFSSLKIIIEEENNWRDVFANDLKVLRNLDRLEFLKKLRNKIAHNRFLSQRNFDELRRIHSHIMHLCCRAFGEISD